METRKFYYEDCDLRQFTAGVISCQETRGGYAVVLDATAFYPEGGGQPCDLGTLADAKVLDVQEKGGKIVHLCDRALEVGSTVKGIIDWERRFDLMQQHTGEHILSGVIHETYGAHNVGFHLGTEVTTVDFDVMIPSQDLEALERRVNQAVFEDLPVQCGYPTAAELEKLAYRSKKALEMPVRIVSVPGYDCCACCGVHTKTTGQVGMVKILSCVKFHQGVRMEILCGGRALALFQKVWEQNRQVCQAFSAKPLETGAAAKRMNEALAAEKFRATGLQKKLLETVAAGYAGKGYGLHFADDLAPAQVRELADKIAGVCGGTAAVFCGSGFCLVNRNEDVNPLGQKLTSTFDGRGGGKDGVFQGSIHATREQVQAFFEDLYQLPVSVYKKGT